MNQGNDQFEGLQKLLALKRHEVPPPGFFNDLSAKIRAEIIMERQNPPSFWQRFFAPLTLKPQLAYAFAGSFCGILLLAFSYSAGLDEEQTVASPGDLKSGTPVRSELVFNPEGEEPTLVSYRANSDSLNSLSPVTLDKPALLMSTPGIRVVPISYTRNVSH
jgi:hypothetical protein